MFEPVQGGKSQSLDNFSFQFEMQDKPIKAFFCAEWDDIFDEEILKWLEKYQASGFVSSLIEVMRKDVPTEDIIDRLGYLFSLAPDLIEEFLDQLDSFNKESSGEKNGIFFLYEKFAEVCFIGFVPEDFKVKSAAKILLETAILNEDPNGEILLNLRLLSHVGKGVLNYFIGAINEYILYGSDTDPLGLYLRVFKGDKEAIRTLSSIISNTWFSDISEWEQYEPLSNISSPLDINGLARIEQIKVRLKEANLS